MTGKMTGQDKSRQKVLGWSPRAAERLKEAVQKFGSQAGVADRADISRPSLVEIVQGRSTPKNGTLAAICSVIGVAPADILDGIGEATVSADFALMTIRQIDAAYGLGGTYHDGTPMETVMQFPTTWVRNYTRAPAEHLYFAHGVGDSMQPTIHDSDLLLIDRSQNHLNMGDKIWAIAYGEIGMIKRLRPTSGQTVSVLSDNPNVPSFEAADGEMSIIGRVVAIVRKM